MTRAPAAAGERPHRAAPATAGRGVLQGAFALLDLIGKLGDVGLSQAAQMSNMPKATAYRLLEQLVGLGAVDKSAGRYRVGPHILMLARAWHPEPALIRALRQPTAALARATASAVGVGVLAHGQVLIIRAIPGPRVPPIVAAAGVALPSSTAIGQVLLAWSAAAMPATAAMPLPRAEQIRQDGAAFDHGTVLPGVHCVAVPIHRGDPADPVTGLCASVDPSYSLPRLTSFAARCSAAISAALR